MTAVVRMCALLLGLLVTGADAASVTKGATEAKPTPYQNIVRCESWDNEKVECPISLEVKKIELTKQMSKETCTDGKSYGSTTKSVWVTSNCRAEFKIETVKEGRLPLIGNTKPRVTKTRPPEPKFKTTKDVKETILIRKPGLYDFGNVMHMWKGEGKCDQGEAQPAVLQIEASNVHVRNFAYKNAPDGLHVFGKEAGEEIKNITLENIVGYACEDAMSLKAVVGFNLLHSTIFENPEYRYRDKILQLASTKKSVIDNTNFVGIERCIRLKTGGEVVIRNSAFYECTSALTADTCAYGGYPADVEIKVDGQNNYFKDVKVAFTMPEKKKVTYNEEDVTKINSTTSIKKFKQDSEYCPKQSHDDPRGENKSK